MRITITQESKDVSEIICERDALSHLCDCKKRKFVFTDSNVHTLYESVLHDYLPDAPFYVMEAGEEHKNEGTLFALLRAMAQAGLRRNDCLVCLGGGVVGDIGGLASALYMRGIACIQIPTTLLAQVDSSVGGKTAVDFCDVKNLVGVFKQPDEVLVDGRFLRTLPAREIRCGLGEIVKHAALDKALFDKLLKTRERLFDLEFLGELVADNIAVKANVVRQDAKEAGLRKCLNLGHTTAHAFELCDGRLSHGEYVLVGMLFEAEIAKRCLACDERYLEQLKELCLSVLGAFPHLPPVHEAAHFAKLDKKNVSEKITLTVPVSKGQYALLDLPYGQYVEYLSAIQEALC